MRLVKFARCHSRLLLQCCVLLLFASLLASLALYAIQMMKLFVKFMLLLVWIVMMP